MSARFRIGDDQHVAIFGRTGSGKTYRALSMLDYVPRWLIIDTKWGIEPARWGKAVPLVTKFNPKYPRQILRAPLALVGEPAEYAHYQYQIMRAFVAGGPRVIYADEVADISPSTVRMGTGYSRVLRLGRGRRVTGWSGTQRPSMIPKVIYTESTHFFFFDLLDEDDKKKAAGFTNNAIRPLFADLHEYDCIYWSPKTREPRIIRANAIDITSVRTHTSASAKRTFTWPHWLRRS